MKKAVLLVMCALLLCGASVLGTLAYLTSQDSVTNTFTVGNIKITLDEAPVNADGQATEGARVKANAYKLVPGKTYSKDPVIHVASGSEKCWLFIKVENGIAGIEDSANTVDTQLKANGWLPLESVANVYYHAVVDATENAVDVNTFTTFKIAGETANDTLAEYGNATVVVTAYAVQEAGFENNAAGAWTAAGFSN